MKRTRFLAIFLAVIVALVVGAPVWASPYPAALPVSFHIVSGIEVFAGIQANGNTYGATFVSQGTGVDNHGNTYYGTLSASVDYVGNGPKYPSNDILGGLWTLTVNGKGIIKGYIGGGTQIIWDGMELHHGAVVLNFFIIGGTGAYIGIHGGGIFTGDDNHFPGIPFLGIRIPTVDGDLTLSY